MTHPTIAREIAERYHRELPDDIRAYLKDRGIPATLIERQRLGWNGTQITIPVFGRNREVLGFRYAKPVEGLGDAEVLSDLQLGTELYGWDTLVRVPHRVVICNGEFERLVLEANGFAAVTSTSDAATFLEEWLQWFTPVRHVYICFSRDLAGAAAARSVQRVLPRACIVTLPADVGEGGNLKEFFVDLGRTKIDFEVLLAAAEGQAAEATDEKPRTVLDFRPHDRSMRQRAENVRRTVRLHDLVANYTDLQASGSWLLGHCPFHEDRSRSFSVYPATNTYQCGVCGAEGGVLKFLMDKESMTVGQAIEALEGFQITHELYGTS